MTAPARHPTAPTQPARYRRTLEVEIASLRSPCKAIWQFTIGRGDFQVQQDRTERLAVRIQRERTRDAAAERVEQHEVQCTEQWQLVALHFALHDAGKKLP